MKYIGIFCSASADIDPAYFEAACELGRWIGEEGKTLVYGGVSLGLMESIARAVKENGGRVTGVVPAILEENGHASSIPDRIISAHNLSDRKEMIVQESEILVALPGGIGTLDEVFHVMAGSTIGYHSKKVIFWNVNGFYNDLFAYLKQLETGGFIHAPLSNYCLVANSTNELLELLK